MPRSPRSLVAAAIALWSFGPLLQKLISQSSQFLLLALVFACGFATFAAILVIQRGRGALAHLKRFRPQYLLLGLCGYMGYMVSMNQCFRRFASPAGPTMLNYTWPVWTLIYTEAIFRRTRKRRLVHLVEGLGTTLGVMAVYVLATRGDLLSFDLDQGEGLLWGLLAGTLYGFFSGYSSTVPGDSHSVFLLSAIGASLLAMLPLAWTERHLLGSLPPGAYLAAVGQGCLMNGMGYFLWTSALREARQQGMAVASITSLIFFLPLTSLTVISVAFRDTEVLRPYFLGTLLLLLGGLGLCQWTDRIVGWIDGRRVRGWEGLNDNG